MPRRSDPQAVIILTTGGLGYGYSSFAPSVYGYPQSYFANPGYGQWGGFGPGF